MTTDKVGQRIQACISKQDVSLAELVSQTGLEERFLTAIIEEDLYPSLGALCFTNPPTCHLRGRLPHDRQWQNTEVQAAGDIGRPLPQGQRQLILIAKTQKD